jgi:hypothetical protein
VSGKNNVSRSINEDQIGITAGNRSLYASQDRRNARSTRRSQAVHDPDNSADFVRLSTDLPTLQNLAKLAMKTLPALSWPACFIQIARHRPGCNISRVTSSRGAQVKSESFNQCRGCGTCRTLIYSPLGVPTLAVASGLHLPAFR